MKRGVPEGQKSERTRAQDLPPGMVRQEFVKNYQLTERRQRTPSNYSLTMTNCKERCLNV